MRLKRIISVILAAVLINLSLSVCYASGMSESSYVAPEANPSNSIPSDEPKKYYSDVSSDNYVISPSSNTAVLPSWTFTDTANTVLANMAGQTSFQINSNTDFYNLALYSKTHSTEGWEISLTGTSGYVLDADKFMGFGSAEHPFAGSIVQSFNDATSIELTEGCAPLCAYMSQSAEIEKIIILASGSQGGLCGVYCPTSDTSPTFTDVTVSGTINNTYATSTGLNNTAALFGLVNIPNGVTANVNLSGVTVTATAVTANQGHAGLIIGSASGKIELAGLTASFSDTSVTARQGNAGTLVGNMAAAAEVSFITAATSETASNITLTSPTVKAYKSSDTNGCAGGIVGCMESGAKFSAAAVSQSGAVINGGNAIGGFAGKATDPVISVTSFVSTTATIGGAFYNGGFIGHCSYSGTGYYRSANCASDSTVSVTSVIRPRTASGATVYSGGLFGHLDIGGNYTMTLGTGTVRAGFEAGACGSAYVGGIIGEYSADTVARTLTVTGVTGAVSVASYITQPSTKVTSYGGLIGIINANSYCEINNVGETTNAFADGATPNYNAGEGDLNTKSFGGVAGIVADGAIVKLGNVSVNGGFSVTQTGADGAGGGVIGKLGNGSVLCLTGTVTLGNKTYARLSNGHAQFLGQVVGYQNNSLVYGETGWNLVRSSATSQKGTDDIGNYGSMIEDGTLDIIELNATTHAITFDSPLDATGNTVTLASAADYAKLAIFLSSDGTFASVTGETAANILSSGAISITDNIVLTGTGLTSLTRGDRKSDVFSGTLSGGGKTITLAIGQERYISAGSGGDGEIYSHKYLGIFSAIGGGVTIENLTVAGAINCAETGFQGYNAVNCNDLETYAGGVAGYCVGGSPTFTSVTTSVEIAEERWYNVYAKVGFYGGLVGYCELTANGGSITATGCTVNTTVTSISNNADYSNIYGGLIGRLATDGHTVSVNLTDTTLSDAFTLTGTTSRFVRIGGLIGHIGSSAEGVAPNTTLNISGLTAAQTYVQLASESAGGLLGYSWERVNCVLQGGTDIEANTVAGSNSATGAASFGGLVNEITGRFRISDTTVTSSFSAAANTDFSHGLLVCKGYNLYMIYGAGNSVSGATVTGLGGSYDSILGNNIETENAEGGILTIENSATVGSCATRFAGHANLRTRYYYNVEAMDILHNRNNYLVGGAVVSAADLILYNILRYADNDFYPRYYFKKTDGSATPTTLSQAANVDVSDSCLYPTNVSGLTYNATAGAKLTFGCTNNAFGTSADQHHLLQCGLFNDVSGNLAVNNLTLSGSVGRPDSRSGALILGTAAGNSTNQRRIDITLNNCAVDGLTVYSPNAYTATDYAPLLINEVSSYVNLTINNFDAAYTGTSKVASSLLGNVGFQTQTASAAGIDLRFTDISGINGKTSAAVFSAASLMYSLNGDATVKGIYNFNKADVTNVNGVPSNAVLGSELTAWKTEYYDVAFLVWHDGTATVAPTGNAYDYSAYLPYTLGGVPRKLLVNIKSSDLSGCGRYKDPYIITSAAELWAIYNFINNNTATDGWKVNYPSDNGCEGAAHYAYSYVAANARFECSGQANISVANMQAYLLGAYYNIGGTITMTQLYYGLGTSEKPFHGVIVGGGTVVMNVGSTVDAMSFIAFSSGSVVKNITVEYSGEYGISGVFGGVIGTVLGGDNIIDTVTVSGGRVTPGTRQNAYVGGLVGYVKRGGVILRGESSVTTAIVNSGNDTTYFFANPYIGRVFEGYVINEHATALGDNGDKNYKIPRIDTVTNKPSITLSGTTVKAVAIDTADEMFIFASAVNSGSLNASVSDAYKETARSRNATYAYVGSNAAAAADDFATATVDDAVITATVSHPYLCSFFSTSTPQLLNSTITITLGADIDLSGYGNGFRGIGNASNMLKISNFNGGSNTVTVSMQQRQYGIPGTTYSYYGGDAIQKFGLLYPSSTALTVQNLTLSGVVTLLNYNSSGVEISGTSNANNVDANMTVGGVFATVAGATTLTAVTLDNLTVKSHGNTGGVAALNNDKNITATGFGMNIVEINAYRNAGGFCGGVSDGTVNITLGASSSNVTVISEMNKHITKVSAGGLVGTQDSAYLNIYGAEREGDTRQTTFDNFTVCTKFASKGGYRVAVGGAVGICLYNLTVDGIKLTNSSIKSDYTVTEDIAISNSYYPGSAGGIVGGEEEGKGKSIEISNCDVINTNVWARNNAGGIIAEYRSVMPKITNCSVSNSSILGASHAGGCTAFAQTGVTSRATFENISVTDTKIASYGNETSSAGGLFGECGARLTLKNSSIDGCSIIASSASGIGETYNNSSLSSITFEIIDVSITNTKVVALYGMGAAACSFLDGKSTLKLRNIYIENVSVLSVNATSGEGSNKENRFNRDTDGVIMSKMLAGAKLFGTNVVVKDVICGVWSAPATKTVKYIYENISTLAVNAGNVNSTNSYRVVGTCNNNEVQITGFSFHTSLEQPAHVDSENYNGGIFYSDYAGATTAAANVANVAKTPAFTNGELNFYGDGMSVSGIKALIANRTLADNAYTLAAPSRLALIENANPNLDYAFNTEGVIPESCSAFPILYVNGNEDELIKEYLNLITNGGFAKKNASAAITGAAVTVTPKVYTVAAEGDTLELDADGAPSISYTDGNFARTQNYDNVAEGVLKLTVLEVQVACPSDGTDGAYTVHVILFYPQVLTVESHVNIINREEYSISALVAATSGTSIITGDIFTAYIEYAYNDVRFGKNWNFEKLINITSNGTLVSSLPAGTKLTLIPLNSADSSSFTPYYYTLESALSVISFNSFTPGAVANLGDLPQLANVTPKLYTSEAGVNYGIERYVLVVEMPVSTTPNAEVFHLHPGLNEANGDNVTIEFNSIGRKEVTVFKDRAMQVEITAGSSALSNSTPVTATCSGSVEYESAFLDVRSVQQHTVAHGVIRYYITDSDSNVVMLPADTVVTVNGVSERITSDSAHYDYVLKDNSNANYDMYAKSEAAYDHVTSVLNGSVFEKSFDTSLSLDFSSVDGQLMNSTFVAGNQYNLKAKFYVTETVEYPQNGKSAESNSITLSVQSDNTPAVIVTVDDAAQIHLGANMLDRDDETNNGVITFNLIMNLSRCTDGYINNILDNNLKVTARLYRKEIVGGGTEYVAIDTANLTISGLTFTDATEGGFAIKQITTANADWDNTWYDTVNRQVRVPLTLTVDLDALTEGGALDVYTNYKLEFSVASVDGSNETVIGTDHFIYSVAKINTTMVD